ncbi:glycosyltransferase family 4 protein [Zobellia sp. 1_MG-2023]|uniref:glycosyltransferase family 4 protein n=1 Tax=Zobellia sp. 1_MG-2023 TaxID=3062626 RepID=UPI0034C650AE
MKLDFIISNMSGGGAQRVMAILVNHFITINFDVRLITLYESEDLYSLNPSIKRIRLIPSSSVKNKKIGAFLSLYKFYKHQDSKPSVIISFITLTNLISILIARIFKIKIIASEHNSHLQVQSPKYLTKFTWQYIYRFADYITVLTSYDIKFYEDRGVNVVIMPNPCTFKPINTNNHSRKKTILAVGSLNRFHHKGFDNLLNLLPPVLSKNSEWDLKIIGEGDKGLKYLTNLAQKNKITHKVEFTGFKNNVNEYMHSASVFVLSSRFEGLPMVLLEAMSQGMACVAYDCKTGPSDIIKNEYNGILVKDQNEHDMQEKLNSIIQDVDKRTSLSNNAILSLEKFSVEAVADRWKKLFNSL